MKFTGNPASIGAGIRLRVAGHLGPVRELHAALGSQSQDAAVSVLAWPGGEVHLWVRWLGGRIEEVAVPPGALQLTVSAERQPTVAFTSFEP